MELDAQFGITPALVLSADAGGLTVSAIVSTYNSEEHIRGCLEDLVGQTLYRKGQLEVIVVDSGSDQNEQAVVREFQARYSRIAYIRTEEREGIYAAWNRGIRRSRGRYLTNANTDDRHRQDSLETMAKHLDEQPNVALVYGDVFVTNFKHQTFASHLRCGYHIRPDYSREMMLSGCHMGPQPMWRRSLHEQVGYFDESFRAAGDYEFWCRLAAFFPMRHIPEFLGLYFENPTGICNSALELTMQEARRVQDTFRAEFPQPKPLEHYIRNYQFPGSVAAHGFVNLGMVTYNRLAYTQRAIDGLLQYTRYPHVLTVVDNASHDGTRQYLRELKAKGIIKTLILLDENVGVAKASNLAWRQEPAAEYYLKVDNDIVIRKPDWLENMIRVIDAVPQIGVLGYNFEPVSYPLQESNGVRFRLKASGNIGGACALIPKRTERCLGCWCEDYGLYGEEDADYGVRVSIAGLLNAYMADEDIGLHLPSGKAPAIDGASLAPDDPGETAEAPEYRRWKDEQRRRNIFGGKFEENVHAYSTGKKSLYCDSKFAKSY